MLYTLCILFTGVYLGQEFTILPSVRIIIGNIMLYLRGLPDPNGQNHIQHGNGNGNWFQYLKKYLFW